MNEDRWDALVLDVEGKQICTTQVGRHEVTLGVQIVVEDPLWRRLCVRSEGDQPDEPGYHIIVAEFERRRGDGVMIFRLPLVFRQGLAL